MVKVIFAAIACLLPPAGCGPPPPQDEVGSTVIERLPNLWEVLPHAPADDLEALVVEALITAQPGRTLAALHADERDHGPAESEQNAHRLREQIEELEVRLAEQDLSEGERVALREELEQLTEQLVSVEEARETAVDRVAENAERLERLRTAARDRLYLLDALSDLTRHQLQTEQEIFVEHGVPFGGNGIPEGWFKDCVAIVYAVENGYHVVGSGVLIGPRVVLTARHVMDKPVTHVVFTGLDVKFPTDDEFIKVANKEAPPPVAPGHPDLAVLILDTPLGLQLTEFATPELYDHVLSGTASVFVAGFGATELHPPGRKVGGTFIADRDSRWVDPVRTGLQDGRELVLIDSRLMGRVDTADGDSGGPAYFLDTDGRFRLGAITSRGVVPLDLALLGVAGGVYVRIDTARDWIDTVLSCHR